MRVTPALTGINSPSTDMRCCRHTRPNGSKPIVTSRWAVLRIPAAASVTTPPLDPLNTVGLAVKFPQSIDHVIKADNTIHQPFGTSPGVPAKAVGEACLDRGRQEVPSGTGNLQ